MTKRPFVSVVMPVYNGGQYLKAAIESILTQTFKNFELVIINDGSTDQSEDIIKTYQDERVRLISRGNKGLVDTLNEGITKARGELIARMDADDISEPTRLEEQVKFLEKYPDIGLVGTTSFIIREDGRYSHVNPVLTEDQDLRKAFLVGNMFVHGSAMVRSDVLKKSGLYRKLALHAEDYDLWVRVAEVSKVANLTNVLYRWRDNSQGVSQKNLEIQSKSAEAVRARYWDEVSSAGRLPKPSFKESFERRKFYNSREDKYKDLRLGALSGVSSRYASYLSFVGRVGDARKELLCAIFYQPWRVYTYIYPLSFILGPDNFVKLVAWLKELKRKIYR